LVASPVFAQESLRQRVEALEAQVVTLNAQMAALLPTVSAIDVHCESGQSLQAALMQVRFRPSRVTVNVFGLCVENVFINRSQLLIRAGAAGAGIAAANPALPVVRSDNPGGGGYHLALTGLTLSGGSTGVSIDLGTQVQMTDCIVRDNQHGIVVGHQGMLQLTNSTVEDNTNGGIAASDGAHVFMSGGVVRNHVGHGVSVGSGATARFTNGALITANQGDGIGVDGGSMVAFGPATASANGSSAGLYAGIAVRGGSMVSLSGGATIDGNSGNGLMLTDTSVAQKSRVETNIQITNNLGWGVACSPAPAVAQLYGFNVNEGTITGNSSGGINCPKSPPPPQ
jgi:hypothetical protein